MTLVVACHHFPWIAYESTDDVWRGMPSSPLNNIHDRMMSGMTCYHRFGLHTRSNDVEGSMLSTPFGSTHSRTTPGVRFLHCPWTAYTIGLHHAWHAIIAFGHHIRSDDVKRCITSLPLGKTHIAQHRAWHAIIALVKHTRSDGIRRDMTSSHLGNTHGRTTSGLACCKDLKVPPRS